jgi:fermentation-respiration switch protein FrsA (DUF1100 family)
MSSSLQPLAPVEPVRFAADDIELAGELRRPAGAGPFPALAFTGPFTGVKDQVVRTYAERLTASGFVTLTLDHRGFGQSGGRRGHEDSQGKLSDLRAAVGRLADHPDVDADRIGMVGICLGGGYAVRAAAVDPRITAVVGIAGAYNSPTWIADQMGSGAYRTALRSFIEHFDEYLPAVAPAGAEAAMAGDEPYAYYGTARSTSEHWRNQVTRGSLHSLMTFDALGAAELLTDTALLVVHGTVDAYCSPELAAELHARARGHKEIAWIDCTQHIDLYDVDRYVDQAVTVTADFLHRRLRVHQITGESSG